MNNMPYGMKTTSIHFQQAVDVELSDLLFARGYIDDILIFSNNIMHLLSHFPEQRVGYLKHSRKATTAATPLLHLSSGHGPCHNKQFKKAPQTNICPKQQRTGTHSHLCRQQRCTRPISRSQTPKSPNLKRMDRKHVQSPPLYGIARGTRMQSSGTCSEGTRTGIS